MKIKLNDIFINGAFKSKEIKLNALKIILNQFQIFRVYFFLIILEKMEI